MNNLRAAIIEDSPEARAALLTILASHHPGIAIVGSASNVEEGVHLLRNTQPELVFMDVQIEGGTSFDILERLLPEQKINFEIIFITAHGNYDNSVRALEYSAMGFIVKPIGNEPLQRALQKASGAIEERKKLLQLDEYQNQLSLLLDNIKGNLQYIDFQLVKGVRRRILVDDIVYLEADKNITYIYLKDASKITAMRNLGHYRKLLTADFKHFIPISEKYVINLHEYRGLLRSSKEVQLSDNIILQASRQGFRDLCNYLEHYQPVNSTRSIANKIGDLIQQFFK